MPLAKLIAQWSEERCSDISRTNPIEGNTTTLMARTVTSIALMI